ncbi:MAG: methyltransferase domain-containing protein [Bacteroidia bacterium]
MEQLIESIKAFDKEVTFESLREFIKGVDIESLNYGTHIIEPKEAGDYGRNELTMEPFECVLVCWPPKTQSAIHFHDGLFGYVWVVEGELDNVFYRDRNGLLEEYAVDRYVRNGLVPEPDGVIHKLRNNHSDQRAVSIHFYFPALHSFDGMRIYNIETGDSGVLSAEAKSAFWIERDGHFKSIDRNAFKYVSYEELNKHKSHVISNVMPKPNSKRVSQMNSEYFCEHADKYDHGDEIHVNRKKYTEAIDDQIASDLRKTGGITKHLDIAIGTGRRALAIREKSGINYNLVGVDISPEMSKIANERGIETHNIDWVNDDVPFADTFDSVTFLYAFGHLACEKCRVTTLEKINKCLHKGGAFYFDLFSIENENEWGPLAKRAFETKGLSEFGYQKGDVFYRKLGYEKIAFVHYFSIPEIKSLLEGAGFKIEWIHNIGYSRNPGQIVHTGKEGNYFVKAIKV